MEALNFVIGLIAGMVLGATVFALFIFAWAMKLAKGEK